MVPTRMRSSAVRPGDRCGAQQSRKTSRFQVSPMVGAALAPVGPLGAPF